MIAHARNGRIFTSGLTERGIGYLTVCILSKLAEIQMINRISKKITPAHTRSVPWPTGSYWGDL